MSVILLGASKLIETGVFDLDQTLVDFVQLHNEVTHRMLKEHFGAIASNTSLPCILYNVPTALSPGLRLTRSLSSAASITLSG
jgi:hypothetical protein